MAKVKVWNRLDGGVSITHFDFSKKDPGETDDEFIERKSVRLRLDESLQGATETIQDDSELPARDDNRNKWRVNPSGKIFIDSKIELPKEALLRKKNSAKAKLISGQPLSSEEVDAIIN